MLVPHPVGPVSRQVADALHGGPGDGEGFDGDGFEVGGVDVDGLDVVGDRDVQLGLWMLFELHYGGFEDADPDLEWDPRLIAFRGELERRLEDQLRRDTATAMEQARESGPAITTQLPAVIAADDGPSLATYLQREATHEQFLHFMRQRSLYHLKESDPQSFVVARVEGPVKVALAELQYDEFGGGRPAALHSAMFAEALTGCGLDPAYGAYAGEASALTLATNNVMSMFGLRRRLRGAALGHLAAFEMTSSVPCRRIVGGIERLGLPPVVAAYFDEHIEADAVHEQVALHNICGTLVEQHPELQDDVLFGAAVCVHLDALAAAQQIAAWQGECDGADAAAGSEPVTESLLQGSM